MGLTQIQTKLLIQENIALAPLTTLKVGGAARFFVEAQTEGEVVAAVNFAAEHELALFILGGGSNVLISDRGFDGLVLHIALKGIDLKENIVTARSGEDWDQLVEFCVNHGLAGLECLSGIPGLVGGTPVQNVGAYGQEVSETIKSVRVFDRKTREILELKNADCKFMYRSSIFNSGQKDRFIVLAVTYNLKPNGAPKIVYKDLREFFGDGQNPGLVETRRAVLEIRRAKSMVIDEHDPNSRSAGSFFKNPIVSKEKFAEIELAAHAMGVEQVPSFSVDENFVKVPAAWLIEKSGFHKGFKLGKTGLSSKHTLAVINLGNAAAADILDLKNKIQKQVKEKFDVDLNPEPVFIGFKENENRG